MINTVKNIIIGALVLIVLGGGLYYYFVIRAENKYLMSQRQLETNTEKLEKMQIEINTLKQKVNEMEMNVDASQVTPMIPREEMRRIQDEKEDLEKQKQQLQQQTEQQKRDAYNTCFANRTQGASDPAVFKKALEECKKETGYDPDATPAPEN